MNHKHNFNDFKKSIENDAKTVLESRSKAVLGVFEILDASQPMYFFAWFECEFS